jgi:Na+-driven multidrug efflux pump
MGLQYSITGIGSVILQTSVNGLGDSAIAAIAAALKVHILLSCPLDGLGQAMAPFAGQNVGAKKIDRISQGLKSAVICGFCVCAILIVIVFFIGRGAVSLFLDRENLSPEIVTEIIEYGNKYLSIISVISAKDWLLLLFLATKWNILSDWINPILNALFQDLSFKGMRLVPRTSGLIL